MKPPKPYLYYADGETYTPQAVAEIFADDSGLQKLYSEDQVKTLLDQAERDNATSNSKDFRPLYTEAQMAEKHVRILHDICHAYGKAGECILLTFKHKVNT